jgi:hypothetical protein
MQYNNFEAILWSIRVNQYDFGNSRSHMPGTCHAAQNYFQTKTWRDQSISFHKWTNTNFDVTCSCKAIISLFSAYRHLEDGCLKHQVFFLICEFQDATKCTIVTATSVLETLPSKNRKWRINFVTVKEEKVSLDMYL